MPEISGSDDVVVRLSLRMDPGEAARMARMTGDEVKRALGGTLSELEGAHKRLAQAMTVETQKQAKEEIKAYQQRTRQLTAGLKEIEREQAKAARGMSANWRRTMEDLENITTVVRGAFDLFRGAAQTAKRLADEMIRTTNVYRSLTGSIQEAAEATDGTVANIDLIIAKNAAVSAGLDMSSSQFAEVAKAADAYADAVGISAKEAMDPFVASLAAGNERMLKRIGVLVDSAAAEKRYAAIVEQSVESLTEEQKRAAFVNEAMTQIIASNQKLNAQPATFADRMEQAFTGVKNAWDGFMAGVGNLRLPTQVDDYLTKWGRLLTLMVNDDSSGDPIRSFFRAESAVKYGLDQKDARMATIAQQGADFKRTMSPDQESDAALKFLEGGKRRKQQKPTAQTITYVAEETVTGLDRLLYAAAIREQEEIAKIASDAWDQALEDRRRDDADFSSSKSIEAQAFMDREDTKARAKMPLSQALKMKDEQGAFIEPWMKDLQSAVEVSREKAGGGLIGQLLFGDDTSLEQTYAKMDEAKRAWIDMVRETSDFTKGAYEAMSGAMGAALAKSIGETGAGTGFKEALKAQTHAVLMGLSQQAYVKSLMHAAEAIGSLAMGNFPGAAAHGAAAAAFAGVGTAAAIGARATFTAPAATGSTPTSVRGSSAGVNNGGRSPGGGNDSASNVFNINVMFGDEESIAKAIAKAIGAYKQKNGKMPPGMN